MKIRDSGMPDQACWSSFFDAECVVEQMFGQMPCEGSVIEFGCGYGTFTLPAAHYTKGSVVALDIESGLIEQLRRTTTQKKIDNIDARCRDFVAEGSGLGDESQSHAMIYNLLHLERPLGLLKEARRVLRPGARLSVIHWRSDISTPRGPALDIRPKPEQCREWIAAAGFSAIRDVDLSDCCQYHFGIVANC